MIRIVIAVFLVFGLGIAASAAQDTSRRTSAAHTRIPAEERFLQEGGRLDERTRCGGEKLPETEAARHSHGDQRRVGRPVRACGSGRGRFPQRPRPPVVTL